MKKPQLFITCPTFPEILSQLSQVFEVEASEQEVDYSGKLLINRCKDKTAVFTAINARFSDSVLEQVPQLKIISTMTVGYDHIDIKACTNRGIIATNTPEILNQTTADFTWALLLATARRVGEAEQWLRAGHWQRWHLRGFLGADVHGKTLGILGMGGIGQAIARRSMGFDMQVLYHNRSRLTSEQEAFANNASYVSKNELLSRSDFVVLMLPYNETTHHCMSTQEFAQMRPGAVLINTARGGVVDDAALIEALRNGPIAAAGLDVFENEPKLNPEFLALPNVVLTPHIASASEPTRRAMQQCAANNLIEFVRSGRVLNRVN